MSRGVLSLRGTPETAVADSRHRWGGHPDRCRRRRLRTGERPYEPSNLTDVPSLLNDQPAIRNPDAARITIDITRGFVDRGSQHIADQRRVHDEPPNRMSAATAGVGVEPAARSRLGRNGVRRCARSCRHVGGYLGSGGPYAGDTWTWDGSKWTEMHPASSPSPRYGAAMAYDEARGQVVLFGGYGNGTYFNDTWTWDGATWTQQNLAAAPSGRVDAAIAYDPVHTRVVLFSGGAAGSPLADTWSWNGRTWTNLQPGSSPPARQGGLMTYDPTRHSLVVAGSVNGNAEAWKPWALDGAAWTPVVMATQSYPPSLYGPFLGGIPTSGQIVLLAGIDTWVWDGTQWGFRASPSSPGPSQRSGGMQTATPMAWDGCRHELVLFSGQGPSGWLTDTWTFDGTTWTRRN